MGNLAKDSFEYNEQRILKLKEKIHKCILNGNQFQVLCFDIDDTLNRSTKATEEQIEKINFKASDKFREMYMQSHPFFGDQEDKEFQKKYYDLRNQILEDYGKYFEAIDYSVIHTEDRLYSTAKEGLKEIANNTEKNTFVILVSHYNPERESIIKIQKYYEYMSLPNGDNLLDVIITLPVFMQKYEPNGPKRSITSKAAYLLHKLELSSKYITNFILIDDSSSVRKDFKSRGGIVIPAYLERGYIEALADDHPGDLKRVITDFDPRKFQDVLDTIKREQQIYEFTKNFDRRNQSYDIETKKHIKRH